MADHAVGVTFALGQPVRTAADVSGRVGYLVAVMLGEPYEGLVRWSATDATFERLEALEEVAPRPHAEGGNGSPWHVPDATA